MKATESTAITPVIESTAIAPVEQDMFAAPEYVNQNARLPVIQALRGENGDKDCGYFIKEKDLASAGWKNIVEEDLIIYEYNSGGKERGLLIKNPRMLVVIRSPLFAFDRIQGRAEEKLIVVGKYDKKKHGTSKEHKEQFGIGQVFEVILLDKNNNPLHDIGFAYIPKGANQATFSINWQKLVEEVTKCHAVANGIPNRGRDSRFNSMCVFDFQVKREIAGTTQKGAACKVDSYLSPTQETWEQFFVGRDEDVANHFLNLLTPTTPLALPQGIDDTVEDGEIVESAVANLEAVLDLGDAKNITPMSLENLFTKWFGCQMSDASSEQIATAIDRIKTM
jgi:Family of unknown function (DUF5895)